MRSPKQLIKVAMFKDLTLVYPERIELVGRCFV